MNFELYGFDIQNKGFFNRNWKLLHIPGPESYQVNPLLTYGLVDSVDVQVSTPYTVILSNQERWHHIGDASVILGYQAMLQGHSKWRPNLRVTLQQVFPTGKFQQLNPVTGSNSATGSGSYQTALSFNFQHLLHVSGLHYLRTRAIFNFLTASKVTLKGYNAYGGNATTNGNIRPGNLASVDISGEFTVTKHWVAVTEGLYSYVGSTSFTGDPGSRVNGKLPTVGKGNDVALSLAPAIEYNFNEHLGIIGGVWFIVKGKNNVDFQTTSIAVNFYW